MLTREQRLLLQSLSKRHAAHAAVVICLPQTMEWEIASTTLDHEAETETGSRFSGTPDMLRSFFEQVNEGYTHAGEEGQPTLYSLLHGP